MKKSLLTLVMLISAFGLSAATRQLNINQPFSELDVSAGVKVIYKISSAATPTVTITGDQDRIKLIDVIIRKNTLCITRAKDVKSSRIKGVTVTLSAPMVREIEASSGASVKCDDTVTISGSMDLDASSGADISFSSLTVDKIEIDASSGADITVRNVKADKAELEASSGASVTAASLAVKGMECEASSGGSVTATGSATTGKFSASSGGSVNASKLSVTNSTVRKSSGGSVDINTK